MKKPILTILFIFFVSTVLSGCDIGKSDKIDSLSGKQTDLHVTETEKLVEDQDYTGEDVLQEESALAEAALVSFFNYLNSNKYKEALSVFEPDETTNSWDFLGSFSISDEGNDKANILENYCQAVGTCLEARVVRSAKENSEEYKITVEFKDADGKTFVLGPCCGATEEEMPSQDKFDFTVRKIDGSFKVITAPLYRP